MELLDVDKLVLFVGFVIPGFVSLKVYELFYPSESRSTSERLIDAIAYSCINYALLLWPIASIEHSDLRTTCLSLYLAFYLFVLFLAPISWVCVLSKLRTTKFFQSVMPHPTEKPWDYVFGLRKEHWILVTLNDGKKIGGKYSVKSFASSAPSTEQLYLEEAWHINDDDGFERAKVDTAGVIILTTDIATVEFFNITYGDKNERQDEDRAIERGLSTPEEQRVSADTGAKAPDRIPTNKKRRPETKSPAQKAVDEA